MVINKLFPVLIGQGVERVILTLQLTFEFGKSLSDFCLDFSPLCWGVKSWTKWVTVQVSSNSDSCRNNHLGLIWREVGGVKLD
jgi:hypothetical protein